MKQKLAEWTNGEGEEMEGVNGSAGGESADKLCI